MIGPFARALVATRNSGVIGPILPSALLLGYKICHIELIKSKFDEVRSSLSCFQVRQLVLYQRGTLLQGKRLDTERAELIAELQATLAPDVAEHVETILASRTPRGHTHTRSPSVLPTSKRMSSVVPAAELSAVESSEALVQPRTLAQPRAHREVHSADSAQAFDAIEPIA